MFQSLKVNKKFIWLILHAKSLCFMLKNSQHAEINSSEKRWWQLKVQVVTTLNISHFIFWVKSSYFLKIFKSLHSFWLTSQSSLLQIHDQRKSLWSLRKVIDQLKKRASLIINNLAMKSVLWVMRKNDSKKQVENKR